MCKLFPCIPILKVLIFFEKSVLVNDAFESYHDPCPIQLQQTLIPEFCYKSLDEFKKRINLLKSPHDWVIENKDEYCLIKEVDLTLVLPKVEIYVSNDLSFFIRIYGWSLSDSHKLYVKYNKSFKYITLSRLISEITVMKLCPGIDAPDINKSLVSLRNGVLFVIARVAWVACLRG